MAKQYSIAGSVWLKNRTAYLVARMQKKDNGGDQVPTVPFKGMTPVI
jgi:hypothetical protein